MPLADRVTPRASAGSAIAIVPAPTRTDETPSVDSTSTRPRSTRTLFLSGPTVIRNLVPLMTAAT
jgi:hypothetical protein